MAPRAATGTGKKEETRSSLCSSLEKSGAQALAAQSPQRRPFVPPVTVSTSWRRVIGWADPLVSRPAVPNRPVLSGDYFLLARRDEIAQLPMISKG